MITIPLKNKVSLLFVSLFPGNKKFYKKVVKSTIFELEKSFKYIFGLAENFWFNGGFKKGGAAAPSHRALNIGSGVVNMGVPQGGLLGRLKDQIGSN